MDSFGRAFRALYRRQNRTIVPEHLSWDQVNDGIYNRMPKKKGRFTPLAWLLLGLALGFLVATLLYQDDNTAPSAVSMEMALKGLDDSKLKAQHPYPSSPDQKTSDSKLTSHNNSSIEKLQQNGTTTAQTTLTKKADKTNGLSRGPVEYLGVNPHHTPINNQKIDENRSNHRTENSNDLVSKQSKNTYSSNKTLPLASPGVHLQHSSVEEDVAQVINSRRIDPIATLPQLARGLSNASIFHINTVNSSYIQPVDKPKSQARFTLISGINLGMGSYHNHPAMEEHVSNDYGFDLGLLVSKPVGRGPYFVEMALLLSEQNQRVQHQSSDEVWVDTTVTIQTVNSVTGSTISRSNADSLIRVNRRRELDHQLSSQRLQLRASVARTYCLGHRLQVNLGAGLQVSRLLYHTGYYLNRSREYQPVSTGNPVYQSWSASIVPSIAFEYQLNNRYAAYLGTNMQMGLTNDTELANTALWTGTASIMTGISIRW